MQVFGFGTLDAADNYSLTLNKGVFQLNETVEFTFTCTALRSAGVRMLYVLDFARKGGKVSTKIFYLDEKNLAAGERYAITRKIELHNYTTRTLHGGLHRISIMLNGDIKM
jgi:hypothetical protein